IFSSRRRHTRSKRDWSSDVCSSDLVVSLLYLRGSLIPGEGAVPEAPLSVRIAVAIFLLLLCTVLGTHLWTRWRRTGNGSTDPGKIGRAACRARADTGGVGARRLAWG